MQKRVFPRSSGRGGIGSGLVVVVGLIEVAVLIALMLWFRSAGACVPPQFRPLSRFLAPGGAQMTGPAQPGGGVDNQNVGAQTGSSQANGQQTATDDANGGSGGAHDSGNVSGDLNAVPDPKCVGNEAASMLNSHSATAPPSCPPMKAPPALQQAAKQVQGLGGQASTASATP